MRWILSFWMLILFVSKAEGHKERNNYRTYGNVRVIVRTGFEYEEVNMGFIIGELAWKLADEMKYKEPICLYFEHGYIPDFGHDFNAVSVEKEWEERGFRISKKSNAKDVIHLRQRMFHFDATSVLKLLEYAIQHKAEIQRKQVTIPYEYPDTIKTLDTLFLQAKLKEKKSPLVERILQSQIERPGTPKDMMGISYYWQEDSYCVFYRDSDGSDKDLFETNSIYALYPLQEWRPVDILFFDTDSTFYYLRHKDISPYTEYKRLKKQFITGERDYRPYQVKEMGPNKVFIYYWTHQKEYPGYKDHTLIYLREEDVLIQDVEKLMERCKGS